MTDVVLLDRFFQRINVHLASCYTDALRWPIILGIFGRSGDGKSIQLSEALERCSVDIIRLNAADLESGLAGEPGKHIERTYATASNAVDKRIPAALIIDDFDTTVGEWEMNTGTVNHQQVLATLMHLADQPVDKARNYPQRVPVFITGNNLTRLYPPLRRHGRMNTFTWRPEPHEVRAVVEGIFASATDVKTLDTLISNFTNEPLSFFAQVRQELVYDEVSGVLKRVGCDMREFLRGSNKHWFDHAQRPVTGLELLQIGRRVQAEQRAALQDFLQEHGPA